MYEIIGITGTVFVLGAFLTDGEKTIRILDAVGAILFVVYGAFIGSLSTIILNTVLVGVQIYKLWKLQKGKKKDTKQE